MTRLQTSALILAIFLVLLFGGWQSNALIHWKHWVESEFHRIDKRADAAAAEREAAKAAAAYLFAPTHIIGAKGQPLRRVDLLDALLQASVTEKK